MDDINKIDLAGYLASLGHYPVSKKGNELRYLSPLKKESFPTFVVFTDTNTWREGKNLNRQTLLEFGILYFDCTIKELQEKFRAHLQNEQKAYPEQSERHQSPVILLNHGQLTSSNLAIFLKSIRIPWDLAKAHCIQAEFGHNGRLQEAVAFVNDEGGYELRNAFFYGRSGPEDKTFIDVGSRVCSVFSDFIDFLSYKAIAQNELQPLTNCLILNNKRLQDNAHSLMREHQKIRLYLPNDSAGNTITQKLTSGSSKYEDLRPLYKHYANLGDWVNHIGTSEHSSQATGHHRLKRSG